MVKLYNEEELNLLKAKKKKHINIIIILSAVIVSIDVLLCFFITDGNETLMKFITSIILSILGLYFITVLIGCIIPFSNRISHLKNVILSEKQEVIVSIDEIGKVYTVTKGIKAYEIKTSTKNRKHSFYYNVDNEDFNFEVGNIVKLIIGNNFIYSYEVVQNEE